MNPDSPLSEEEMAIVALLRLTRRKKAAWYLLPKDKRGDLGREIQKINNHILSIMKTNLRSDQPEEWTPERRQAEQFVRSTMEREP